jgi:hypothetical protein
MKKVFYFSFLTLLFTFNSCSKDDSSSNDSIPMDDKQEIAANIFASSMSSSMTVNNMKSSSSYSSELDYTLTGDEGGSVNVKGSISETITIDDNTYEMTSAVINMNLNESFNNYVVTTTKAHKYTISTSSPITVTANFTMNSSYSFDSNSKMTIKGTLQVTGYASGSIKYDLTITINNTGTGGTMTGTINGSKVNVNISETGKK